jgi:serine/threonine protein kinase/Tfp pilus assembly protein PilF
MSQRLGERYQPLEILGSHAFGKTYLAEDTHLLDRPKCIVKQLQYPDTSPKSYKLLKVLLEKKAEALIDIAAHPQIAQLLDYFDSGQYFYLVEEFIPGSALSAEIRSSHPLPSAQVIPLLRDSLTALNVVHNAGLIHLNLKPSNILRRASTGELVLIGFGIFKDICDRAWQSHHNAPALSRNGSALYIPPEQQAHQPQFNSDLYALGAIAIQAATGYSLAELATYRFDTAANAEKAWYDGLSLDRRLIRLLERMVRRDSQQRYQLAKDVLADLQALEQPTTAATITVLPSARNAKRIDPLPPSAPPKSPSPPAKTSLTAQPWGWRWGIAASLVIGAIALLMAARLPQRLASSYLSHQGRAAASDPQALQTYSRALSLHPHNTQALYQRALIHERLGNTAAALEDLTAAIQHQSAPAAAYYQRGNLRLQLGDNQGAIADYSQALTIEPNYAEVYVNRGNARADLGDDRQAAQDYTKAIELDEKSAAAYLNRCLSRSNLGDHFGAVEDCTTAINLRPTHTYAYQNRGLARRRLGDFSGAITDYNTAIQLDPEDADPYYNRGLARHDLGDSSGAIDDLSTAIDLNPQHVLAYYDRALFYLKQNDRIAAIADLQTTASLCLELSRLGCYEDAQYQLNQLGVESSDSTTIGKPKED